MRKELHLRTFLFTNTLCLCLTSSLLSMDWLEDTGESSYPELDTTMAVPFVGSEP